MPEKFRKVAEMVMKRYNLHPMHPKRSQVFGKEQYGRKVLDVVNKSFGHLYGYSQMTERQIDEYLKMYFPMLDMELICLIEDWNTPNHDIIGVVLMTMPIKHKHQILIKLANQSLLIFVIVALNTSPSISEIGLLTPAVFLMMAKLIKTLF